MNIGFSPTTSYTPPRMQSHKPVTFGTKVPAHLKPLGKREAQLRLYLDTGLQAFKNLFKFSKKDKASQSNEISVKETTSPQPHQSNIRETKSLQPNPPSESFSWVTQQGQSYIGHNRQPSADKNYKRISDSPSFKQAKEMTQHYINQAETARVAREVVNRFTLGQPASVTSVDWEGSNFPKGLTRSSAS